MHYIKKLFVIDSKLNSISFLKRLKGGGENGNIQVMSRILQKEALIS